MTPPLHWQTLRGAALHAHTAPLATLRLDVFRDWPYLYDGTPEYEQQYLQTYANCPDSLVVLVQDGTRPIAATTALPLAAAPHAMRAPFEQAGLAVEDTLYLGESVVLKSYRGRGLGVAFFAHREAHARALGLRRCAFCAVSRPADHPLKPPGDGGNEAFWQRRGYQPQPQLVCTFDWQDIGEPAATPHRLTYWWRDL